MPLSFQNGIQSDDSAASIEKSTCSESKNKSSYRTSVFVEHPDLPPVWGKDSQSGYKGRRVLGLLPDLHTGGPYANGGPLGAYDPRYNKPARISRPLDIGYEMPERYRGKEIGWKEEDVVPLSGNSNSWAPPIVQQKRICGIARVNNILFTSTRSSISTSTLSNGNVILITQVFTTIQTFVPSPTTTSKSQTASTTDGSPLSISISATSTSTSALAGSTQNSTSTTTTPASGNATSTTTSESPTSTPSSSSTIIFPLDCPSINGTSVSATAGKATSTYTILCNTDLTTTILNTITATSLQECVNACAQYSILQANTCRAATFDAGKATGNCFLKSEGGATFSTGSGSAVALALLQS